MASGIVLIRRASSPSRFRRSWLGSQPHTRLRRPLLIWIRLLGSGSASELNDVTSGSSCSKTSRHLERILDRSKPRCRPGRSKCERHSRFALAANLVRFRAVQSLATPQKPADTLLISGRQFSARLALPLLFFSALWFVLCKQLSGEWLVNEQYNYGWFVPFFALYLFWFRWQDRPEPEVRGQKSEVRSRTL